MFSELNNSTSKPDFTLPWLVVGIMITMQIVYIIICHSFGMEIQQTINEEQRVFIRTLFYVIAISTFPLTSLIRHIFLRLNQTMPGNKTAKQRYLLTVIVSQGIIESIGVLGFVMFILGDDFNTLYIFSGLAILGFFLQRPRQDEYQSIVDALGNQKNTS